MKLSALNVAIRNNDGAPKVRIQTDPDDRVGITVGLVKGDLLNGLKERFTRNEETGLWIDANGWLRKESSRSSSDSEDEGMAGDD